MTAAQVAISTPILLPSFTRFPEFVNDDMLTDEGELDPNIFADYLCDNVASKLIMDFDFGDYEDVSYPNVDVATEQEIEEKF